MRHYFDNWKRNVLHKQIQIVSSGSFHNVWRSRMMKRRLPRSQNKRSLKCHFQWELASPMSELSHKKAEDWAEGVSRVFLTLLKMMPLKGLSKATLTSICCFPHMTSRSTIFAMSLGRSLCQNSRPFPDGGNCAKAHEKIWKERAKG